MTSASRCAACGGEIALWAARPRITSDGHVEVECDPCASGLRPVVLAVELPAEPLEPPRRRSWLGTTATTVALVGLTLIGASSTQRPRAASAAVAEPAPAAGRPRPGNRAQVVEPHEDEDLDEDGEPVGIAARAPALALPAIPEREGESLDEWFPTLRDWVHPVPGSPDVAPHQASRFFGAKRSHHERPECGDGHCGVDLEGVRGQPVVAVAWGTVERIQTDPNHFGGRYVRIEHPDFVYTSYFHLDRIAPGLAVGDEVESGQPIGELGKSGIHISMPHLHFSLELPDESGGNIRFVDPVPFLARAQVLPRDAIPDFPKDEPADAGANTPSEGPGEP